MTGVSKERIRTSWNRYQTGRIGLPEHLKEQVREFIQTVMEGKGLKEREAAAEGFYAYLRGRLEAEGWRTPGEWEAEYGAELPAGALVWIRWGGSTEWKPARWGEAKGFSAQVLEVLVCRGPGEPARPELKQVKAERKQGRIMSTEREG